MNPEHQRHHAEQMLIDTLQKKGSIKMKWNGEININVLITCGSLLVSGALAYGALDKRISILEELQKERGARVESELQEVKNQLKELMRVLNERKDRS